MHSNLFILDTDKAPFVVALEYLAVIHTSIPAVRYGTALATFLFIERETEGLD